MPIVNVHLNVSTERMAGVDIKRTVRPQTWLTRITKFSRYPLLLSALRSSIEVLTVLLMSVLGPFQEWSMYVPQLNLCMMCSAMPTTIMSNDSKNKNEKMCIWLAGSLPSSTVKWLILYLLRLPTFEWCFIEIICLHPISWDTSTKMKLDITSHPLCFLCDLSPSPSPCTARANPCPDQKVPVVICKKDDRVAIIVYNGGDKRTRTVVTCPFGNRFPPLSNPTASKPVIYTVTFHSFKF